MKETIEIGAYEAKTRLPEYVRQVREGRRFFITQRGEPVAELVPVGGAERARSTEAASCLQRFMHDQRMRANRAGAVVDLKALIEEGRD